MIPMSDKQNPQREGEREGGGEGVVPRPSFYDKTGSDVRKQLLGTWWVGDAEDEASPMMTGLITSRPTNLRPQQRSTANPSIRVAHVTIRESTIAEF